MSVNITNIMSLLLGEKVGTPGSWTNMASTVQNSCHNYKIQGVSTCNGDIPTTTLFMEIPAFDPITMKENKKGFESGVGQEVIAWLSLEPVLSFQLLADETIHNLFQRIRLHETVTFTRLHGSGAPEEVDVATVEVQASAEDVITRIDVKIFFKDSLSIKKICCGSYYEDAPYSECDGEGETGDPNNDPTCTGLTVAISLGAGPVLTATPAGGPGAGVEVYTWYLDGVFFGTGAGVVPTLSGVYRVDYQIGNCYATDEFTYNTPCEDFEVVVTELVLGDGTILLIAAPNLVSTIQWQIFNDPDWEDIPGETEAIYQPDTDGTFRAVATTTAECEAISNEVVIELGVTCLGLYALEIAIVDDVVETTISDYAGEGVPSYTWYLDQGEGEELQAWTGASTPASVPGLYVVHVLLDGCLQIAQVFVNCEMTAQPCGDPCDLSGFQDFGPGVTGNEFTITNFVLLDPMFYSDDQINSVLMIEKNGNRIYHGLTGRVGYSIDYATQKIVLDPAWPLVATDHLTATKLK